MSNVVAELIGSGLALRLSRAGLYYWFKEADSVLGQRGPYDLVAVDAPQWIFGRDGALHTAWRYLSPNVLIILEDAGRNGEQWTPYRWQQIYPSLEVTFFDTEFGGRGVAMLQTRGQMKRKLATVAALSSIYHALRYRHLQRSLDFWSGCHQVGRASGIVPPCDAVALCAKPGQQAAPHRVSSSDISRRLTHPPQS